ncbi:Fatty acid desaturase type 1 [Penicillium cf. griseofulvum]|uniref:Fatty acid desaturase type 1 n=1 Tax=Penicillium cf. griseofulvum TaxID=2972120 RepID=A0A9W9MTD7_9EURO|nr:Fatty acid desaturase type 1 [Penicillium cf. griseofulvum]KAJ5446309.1 Fatty acid desaturase type 1 [Penicillium cf. griseofulvum]KAJ5448052.1 Fatty acid desaturase type 1 [Penicillium cf. griseofulvum]
MHLPVNPQLTLPDLLVIKELLSQDEQENGHSNKDTIEMLKSLNETSDPDFDPTVFQLWETHLLREKLPRPIRQDLLEPYIRWAQDIVRFPTDVVVVTHLLLYLTTTIPSALWLFNHFSWIHGLLHWIVHVWYTGSYTLMKHQYIHMNGVLASRYHLVDLLFPYILDPFMGHTWNSYYYHHVKMHHVEGNGPRDLSSTMSYDRDSIADFARYVGRFFFLVSLELPWYFIRKGQYSTSFKTAFWEFSNFLAIALLFRYDAQATLCVFLLPLWTLRVGFMAGNWAQHAFVDPRDPSSDFKSSITLIDVASNRFCFNDGYHTSHHLHPRRHWREHPVALLRDQERYSDEQALVFQNVDYFMLTVNLLRKNYAHLAQCMVPIGAEQRAMSLEQREDLLRSRTRRFSGLHLEQNSGSKRR